MQTGILRQLLDHEVPAVLLAPAIMIDQVSPELREYRVFRHYATTYSLVTTTACAFLVDPVRGARLSPPASPVGSEAHSAGLDEYCYHMGDLDLLPASWGHSWPALQHYFSSVVSINPAARTFTHHVESRDHQTLTPTGPNPYIEYALPIEASIGKNVDFLRLGFTFDPAAPPPLNGPPNNPKVTFRFVTRSSGQYSKPFVLEAPSGELLIPLGAYPRWLLARDLMTLRIDITNPDCLHSFQFTKIEFLHLNDEVLP